MAAPVVQSTSTATTSGTPNLTINKPTGTASGDLLVILLGHYYNAAAFSLSGWTALTSVGTVDQRHLQVLYKVAGGSEPSSYTFTSASGDEYVHATMLRISGADAAAILSATALTATSPSLTTVSADNLLISVNTTSASNTTYGVPSGMTGGTKVNSILGSHDWVQQNIAATGATGTRAWTHGGTSYSISIAIPPAAAATGTIAPTYIAVGTIGFSSNDSGPTPTFALGI